MSSPIIYLPEAQADIESAFQAYEATRAGLGEHFLNRVRQRLDVISENPEIYAVLSDSVRAACLRQFPYVVYYRFADENIFVLAVLHGHRDAETWQNRL